MRAVASPAAPAARCPSCGRPASADDLACGMCGTVLARPPGPRANAVAAVVPAATRRVLGIPEPWFFLLLGLALAPVLTLAPLLRYVGWFLASLVHETGHAAISWFLGCPAVPAIRIDGHAAAVHGPQSKLLCVLVLAALAGLAWASRRRPALCVALAVSAAAYPLLAFTGMREVVFLAGGHVGELTFATVFLARCLGGGFTDSRAERATNGLLGWYLVLRHAWLCGGLLWSEPARQAYARSGSFGLANDYVRLAGDLGTRLSTVGGMMLLPTLVVVPAAIWLSRR